MLPFDLHMVQFAYTYCLYLVFKRTGNPSLPVLQLRHRTCKISAHVQMCIVRPQKPRIFTAQLSVGAIVHPDSESSETQGLRMASVRAVATGSHEKVYIILVTQKNGEEAGSPAPGVLAMTLVRFRAVVCVPMGYVTQWGEGYCILIRPLRLQES